MKLVALVKPAADAVEAARILADAAGMAAAEARMRLAPEPPALLARLDDAAADALAANLRKAGLDALTIDARVPGDEGRLVARKFAFEPDKLRLEPRTGDAWDLPWAEVTLILRAQRTRRAETEQVEKSKRFSFGAALATGGLKMTRSTSQVVRTAEEQPEQLILLYAEDGRSASLAEGALDFSGLGALQPSRTANLIELCKRLRERSPQAIYDERLVRLGRRPLPFGVAGEQRVMTGQTSTLHTDTAGTVDVLAEVLRRALLRGA